VHCAALLMSLLACTRKNHFLRFCMLFPRLLSEILFMFSTLCRCHFALVGPTLQLSWWHVCHLCCFACCFVFVAHCALVCFIGPSAAAPLLFDSSSHRENSALLLLLQTILRWHTSHATWCKFCTKQSKKKENVLKDMSCTPGSLLQLLCMPSLQNVNQW